MAAINEDTIGVLPTPQKACFLQELLHEMTVYRKAIFGGGQRTGSKGSHGLWATAPKTRP